jgi:hypothetical protein
MREWVAEIVSVKCQGGVRLAELDETQTRGLPS